MASQSSGIRLRIFWMVAAATVIYLTHPVWIPFYKWTGFALNELRLETVGDDMWRSFKVIQRAEETISRDEVLKRLGEPDERLDRGAELPADLARRYGVPQHEGGEGGLFIYMSGRPTAYCYIFFDAEGNVEKVVTRSLE